MLLPQWRWLELVFWPAWLVLLSAVVWLELLFWLAWLADQLEAHACQMEAQAVDVAASGRW